MKIKSALATSISGSIGGLTGSHNRGGLYLRARRVPTNPNTYSQAIVRGILGAISSRWGTLAASQHSAWNTFASNVPVINALGDSITLSGQQWYVKANTLLLRNGVAAVDDAPTVFALASLTQPVLASAAELTQDLSLEFTNTDDWANETDGGLQVQVSRPQSPGVTYYGGPWLKSTTIDGSATPPTSPATIGSIYTIAAGQKMWVRVTAFRADGRPSPAMILGPVVVA